MQVKILFLKNAKIRKTTPLDRPPIGGAFRSVSFFLFKAEFIHLVAYDMIPFSAAVGAPSSEAPCVGFIWCVSKRPHETAITKKKRLTELGQRICAALCMLFSYQLVFASWRKDNGKEDVPGFLEVNCQRRYVGKIETREIPIQKEGTMTTVV